MHRNENRSHSRSNSRSRSKSRNSRSNNRSRSRSNNSRKKVYRKKEAPQAQSESSQQASLQIENGQSNQESNNMSNDNNEEYSKPKFVDSGKKRTLKEGDYVCLKKQLEAAGTIRRLAKKAALIEFKNGAWGWFGAKKLYPMSEDEFENRKSNFVIDKNLPSPSPSPALTDATDVSHITINDDSTHNGNGNDNNNNNDSSPYLSVNKNDELTKYINENKNSKGKPVSIYQQMAGNLIALPDEKEKELQSPMSTSSITHNDNNNNNNDDNNDNNNENNDNKEELRNENDNTRQDSSKNETETETVESEKMKNDISSTLIDEKNDENTKYNDKNENDDNDNNNNTTNSENDNSNTSENDENGATELEKENKRKSKTKKNKNKKDKKDKKDEKDEKVARIGKSSLESSEELAKKRNSKSLMENRLKIDESERMRREFERKLKLHYKVTDERERTFLVIADESRLIYESTFLKYFKAIVFLNNSDKISPLFDNKKYKTVEKENSAKDDSIIKFFNYISENTNPLTFSKFVKCIDDDGDIVDAYIRWFNTGKSRASRGKGHLQTQTSIQK